MIGVLTGFLGVAIDVTIRMLAEYKYSKLKECILYMLYKYTTWIVQFS